MLTKKLTDVRSIENLTTLPRKGPQSRGTRLVAVTALYKPYNRDMKRAPVYAVEYQAPTDASLEELIVLAHKAGATVGHHSLAGVIKVETPTGSWYARGGKLLTRSNSGVSDHATFTNGRSGSILKATALRAAGER